MKKNVLGSWSIRRGILQWMLGGFLTTSLAVAAPEPVEPTEQPPQQTAMTPWNWREEAVPESLRPWTPWVLWRRNLDQNSPRPYNRPDTRWGLWPGTLQIEADGAGATFVVRARMFQADWLTLPGGTGPGQVWPQQVEVADRGSEISSPAPFSPGLVLERQGRPAVWLEPGDWQIRGKFFWPTLPERLLVPPDTGVLQARVDGRELEMPMPDGGGALWLRQDPRSEETTENFLALQAYGLIEDGAPLWLRMEIELTVSGEAREENLGCVIPPGWKLAAVDSPIPVMIEENGQALARVKAGRWMVRLSAFRLDHPTTLAFPDGARFSEWLVAFQARPDFRSVEVEGVVSVDVAQTTFPDPWRGNPVYRWDKGSSLTLTERQRGSGETAPSGLIVNRDWWLGEDGKEFVFRDRIQGTAQTIWRLDATEGQTPGAVTQNGRGLLLTRNPDTGTTGVEIRERELNLTATGTMSRTESLSATGWNADADRLEVRLHLPPGWRALAVHGPDWVNGEWITLWSLLDLFVLLLFTLALFRLYGTGIAILGFLTLALTYHEIGSARFSWLALLAPLALLGVVQHAKVRVWLQAWKWLSAVVLLAILVPFISQQVQQALFPQLENPDMYPQGSVVFDSEVQKAADFMMQTAPSPAPLEADQSSMTSSIREYTAGWGKGTPSRRAEMKNEGNLGFDPKARIQTGPGIPQWSWRTVLLQWNSPVTAGATIEAVLIPPALERALGAIRVLLVLILAWVLLRRPARLHAGKKPSSIPASVPGAAAALLLVTGIFSASPVHATEAFPPPELLQTLEQRLLEPPDAFPNAAEIAVAKLELTERQLSLELEIHAAADVAIPLPGRLPAWSPLSIEMDGAPASAVRRADEAVWIAVPEGIHHVHVRGLIPDTLEWDWSFNLRPRRVEISAPGWTVTGLRPDGTPENQILFARTPPEAGDPVKTGGTTFDRQPLENLVQVRRSIELGLNWRVHTEVIRLTPAGRPFSLRIPALPGENIVTPQIESGGEGADRWVEVRFGANQNRLAWDGELSPTGELVLQTPEHAAWVEYWEVIASAVWNVRSEGIAPIFEANLSELRPIWLPWPGENVHLFIERPEAVPGATITVDSATYTLSPGLRQTTGRLEVALRASLADSFSVGLPPESEITGLLLDGKPSPVRREQDSLLIPVRPGAQSIEISWRMPEGIAFRTASPPVSFSEIPANLNLQMDVPSDRWVLWTEGPLRGPAVRFWTVLVVSLLAALVLARVPASPLSTVEWLLLGLGLTQAALPTTACIVAWLFFIAWRGQPSFQKLPRPAYNGAQILLVAATPPVLLALLWVVAEGLLGSPEMFVSGQGSSASQLIWYSNPSTAEIPPVAFLSISIWWYRLAMLLWALWLALALLRWIQTGWRHLLEGGFFKRKSPPPPLPASKS